MAAASVSSARLLTLVSWFTYPFVHIIMNVGFVGRVANGSWLGARRRQQAGGRPPAWQRLLFPVHAS